MFTSADYIRAKRGYFMHLGICIGIFAVMVGVFGAMLVIRARFAAMAALLLGGWCAYFYGTMVFGPWRRYYRLMKDMHEGLSRTYEALFVSVSPDARTLGGVEVNDFIVCEENDQSVELLYLWDADKPVPDTYKKGQKLRIESFGNYIKNIEVV